ncbi:MAG: hypothetical protein JXR14_02465 [Paracoccaceae bacterium]
MDYYLRVIKDAKDCEDLFAAEMEALEKFTEDDDPLEWMDSALEELDRRFLYVNKEVSRLSRLVEISALRATAWIAVRNYYDQ